MLWWWIASMVACYSLLVKTGRTMFGRVSDIDPIVRKDASP